MSLVLATRASRLARWQAETASDLLVCTGMAPFVELLLVTSAGDRDQTSELSRFGQTGVFTAEIDCAVLDGRADAGVHSLKDMTTSLEEGLILAGVLSRGPIEDAWICPSGARLDEIAAGARVATGSRRRAAMLRAARADLEVVEMRGNVETRLERLREGAAEAMLLACAGLVRLGLEEHITERLDTQRFLPAAGQGLIGLTCRADDSETTQRLRAVTDPDSYHSGLAERALLAELGGGCSLPLGANARVTDGLLSLSARILSLDGARCVEGSIEGAAEAAEGLGRKLADELRGRGAAELIEAAQR